MRQKKFWLITVLVLALAAAGGYYYYQTVYLPTQVSAPAETLQTARVRRGDLTLSASSVGTLTPVQTVALGFRSSGVLAALTVQPGDAVQAGQVLARLDDTDAQAQLAQAQTNLRLAQLKLAQSADTLAQAEANRQLARLKLEALLAGPDAAAMAAAQANLVSAQTELATLLSGPTGDDLTVAAAEVEQAAIALRQAQTAYDTVAWADDVGESPQAAALQAATLTYQKNLAAYRLKTADPTPDKISAAKAKIAQAQQQVDALSAGPTDPDVAAARIAVEQAEAAVKTAGDTTALAIGVEQAQLAVETAQRAVDNAVLRAPLAGIITEVKAAAGETVGTAPLLTLIDLSRLQLALYLDETDLDKLTVGNPVEAVFDARPSLTLPGRLVRVNPTLVTIDGVPAVSALAELEPLTDPAVTLLPGMSAAVEVIAGRATDTLLVPVEALRTLGEGQYAVFVLTGGQPKLRPVQVGLQDLTYAQILDGLAQGDEVTTGIVATE